MTLEDAKQQIISKAKTLQEAESLMLEIDRAVGQLFKDSLEGIDPDLLRFVNEAKENLHDAESLGKILSGLRMEISNMPVLTVSVAFNLSRDDILDICNWVASNVKKRVLLDFEFDPEVVGGCILSFNGVRKDYSLNSLLEDLCAKRGIRKFIE